MPMDFQMVGYKEKMKLEDDDDVQGGRRDFSKSIVKYLQRKGIVKSATQGALLVLITIFAIVIATWYIATEFEVFKQKDVGLITVLQGQPCPEGTVSISSPMSQSKGVICMYEESE
jgi:hypothetical protein